MTKQEAKQWAELFTAYAEGKTIEFRRYIKTDDAEWVVVTKIDTTQDVNDYRIKPTPKTRRMTNQELADWLRDEPQEHREFTAEDRESVWCFYSYNEDVANESCEDFLIRRNHGEWEEPLIEVEE